MDHFKIRALKDGGIGLMAVAAEGAYNGSG